LFGGLLLCIYYACDPAKRAALLREREFDLFDMAEVFDDARRLDFTDLRFDYGEERRITIGRAIERVFTVVYTVRGQVTWLITAWPSSRRSAVAMRSAKPIVFTQLSDGTLLRRRTDGTYAPTRSKSNRARIASWTDDEIEKMAASDPEHPALDDAFWASVDDVQKKEPISIKLDRDVLAFFRSQGRGYQTRINAVLRQYMKSRRKAG
jgi:uncharacterized protein (DUF4415 family)/uncharacterized DUF497 family protein